jgi:SUKH-4 immunity protein
MTPEAFKAAWEKGEDRLVRFPQSVLDATAIPLTARTFLMAAGLPREAAPFLSFRAPHPSLPPTVASRGLVIGSNGSGDLFLIVPDGRVQLLDHERGGAVVFVNSSLDAFASALLLFRAMVSEVDNPEHGTSEEERLRVLGDRFVAELARVDPRACARWAFWSAEVDMWRAAAKNPLDNYAKSQRA